jgi:hypothetical protein
MLVCQAAVWNGYSKWVVAQTYKKDECLQLVNMRGKFLFQITVHRPGEFYLKGEMTAKFFWSRRHVFVANPSACQTIRTRQVPKMKQARWLPVHKTPVCVVRFGGGSFLIIKTYGSGSFEHVLRGHDT